MEKSTLNTNWLYLVFTLIIFLVLSSCTKDTADDALYEENARKKNYSPIERPKVDKTKVTTGPVRTG